MKKDILIYSASDRYNLGDMLYPIVLKHFLMENGVQNEIKYFALTSSNLASDGAIPTKGYKDLQKELKRKQKKILFIAGGDGLSGSKDDLFSHSSILDNISSKITSNSNIFFRILQKIYWLYREKKRKNIPKYPFHFKKSVQTTVVYNSIGGSRNFNNKQAIEFLNNVDLCSVRTFSDYNVFNNNPKIKLAPDFVTLLSLLYTVPHIQSISIPYTKYIFFQISKNAYIEHQLDVINALDSIFYKTGIPFVFCPIGLAFEHEDFFALNQISSKIKAKHILIKRPHINDTIHLLANATLYIGTSLHGTIVSMSYAKPYIGMRFIKKVADYLDTWSINCLKGCSDYRFLPTTVYNILNDSSIDTKLKEQRKNLINKTLDNFNFLYSFINDNKVIKCKFQSQEPNDEKKISD